MSSLYGDALWPQPVNNCHAKNRTSPRLEGNAVKKANFSEARKG